VLDIKTDSALTSLTVSRLILEEDTAYLWRARFYDNHGAPSEWSDFSSFTTLATGEDADGNGILDHQEVDLSTDLDGDGTADIEQTTIKSVTTEGGSTQIGVSIKGSPSVLAIDAIESEASDNYVATAGIPDEMPFGLINFKLSVKNPGNQAVVNVYLSEAAAENAMWYKYDPVNGEWQNYADYAEFSIDRKSVTLTLEDGGFGDTDGLANGIIVDPAGIGVVLASDSGSSASGGSACFISAIAQDPSSGLQKNMLEDYKSGLSIIIFLMVSLCCGCAARYLKVLQKSKN
jgi:hypothetical protein